MRGSLRIDALALVASPPWNAYRGPWWLLRIPGRHVVPTFARRSWWTWIPAGAEVFAIAEATA